MTFTFLILSWLVQCIFLFLAVAFYTLFERKVIGVFHLRLGPNKVSFLGLLQPLLDAFKLLSKQNLAPLRSNKFIYHLSPILSLLLSLLIWTTMPLFFLSISIGYSLVVFFCLGSIMVFSVLMSGWSSNSKYSLIGSLRSIAQSISYESVFSTIIVLVMVCVMSFSVRSFTPFSSPLFLLLFPIWFICTLAETHRAPFDFSEAESELVSGFNTEYSGAYFAFLFLSEYMILLYSCMLMTFIFFSFFLPYSFICIVIVTLLLSFFFIWVRVTFCRYRYDMLIRIAWKVLLPTSLILFIIFLSLTLLPFSL